MAELRWGATTNPGRVRSENEDTFVTEPMVFAVADGMGGHQAGEVASALAASIVRDRLGRGAVSEDDAESVIHEINAAIFGAARANAAQNGMGTTLTALAVLKPQGQGASLIDEQLVLLNVGDSRTYLLRSGKLSRVTVDHSYVQELVATGHITMEEARTHPRRNIVTRALGIEPNVRADMWTMPVVRGDRFVLCSDGLVDEVPDSEILELVSTVDDPQSLTEQLVELANSHGGRDNVTVVVVDVLEGADPPDPTAELALDEALAGVLADGVDDAVIWNESSEPVPFESEVESTPEVSPETPLDPPGATPTVPPPAVPLGATQTMAAVAPAAAPLVPTLPPATNDSGSSLSGKKSRKGDKPGKPARSEKPSKTDMPGKPAKHRTRRLTGGLFLFVVVLAAIIIATFTLIAVHARSGYFVAFHGDKVAVYKGQPDGLLWFEPTLVRDSSLTRQQLDPTLIAVIEKHVTYDSADEAAAFITEQVIPTTTVETTTTTTAPASTTTAATVPGETTTTISSGP